MCFTLMRRTSVALRKLKLMLSTAVGTGWEGSAMAEKKEMKTAQSNCQQLGSATIASKKQGGKLWIQDTDTSRIHIGIKAMDALPDWPPAASNHDIAELLTDSRDYALSHSILYRPVEPSSTSAIHAPFALFPSPFPRELYDRVVRLQTAYNELYAEIASDHAFLEKVIGGNVIKVDEFQERLYRIWMKVREDKAQPLQLGLFRSDYLLHCPSSSSSSSSSASSVSEMHIKQVEFNTISSSFGGLSSKVTDMHR